MFKTITGIFILASTAVEGHMIMANPKPFGGPDLDNSPLTNTNYPCKLKGDPATFYNAAGLDNTMAVGETQTLSFKGSAVHGGGSCQLAITKDMQPSVSTSWQVIESIEGGCPSKSGQGADTYDWKIPEGVEPGKYVFTWTWISKLAGQPEYYQNCAPITVTGGSKKRSSANETYELVSRDNSFPELFVANLASINSCKTTPGTDPEYPDPGSNVVRPGTNNKFGKVTGDNCVPKGAKSSGGSSGSNGNINANTGSGSSDSGNSGSAPASNSSSSASSAASSPAGAPTPSGFVTSVIPAGSSAPAFQAPSSAAAGSPVPSPAGSASPAGSGAPSSGSAGGLTGSCTSEGMFNCIGGTSYQQCASGSWSVVMQMPATTKCAPGQTMTLWGRDEMKHE
ncbi:lytic polysaccharide monooxygenase [Annulohypoxylon moriforme]|nr:lytic polysaccharide monooxygenase [Annulohypoxylon moriforme]